MDYGNALKRAWEITWRYPALWIFGAVLALTTGGASWSLCRGDEDNGFQYTFGNEDLFHFRAEQLPPSEIMSIVIAIGIGIVCVILLMIVATTVARYLSETALIRMVGDYEETGEKRGVRQGLRMGWSRSAWRLFLIKFLISLPTTLAFILLFLIALAPTLLWITGSTAAGVIGTLTTLGLLLPLLFLLIVVTALLTVLIRFFWRTCALEEQGVLESIRQGFGVVRRHLGDVVVVWLITLGVRIGWTIATIALAIVLFPAIILLITVASALGAVPALVVGGLASLFVEGAVPWVLGALVGFPIFILVVAAPWVFLGGLEEVLLSSLWTVTYRELRALESPQTVLAEAPEPDVPGLVAAPVA
jgi:hypothetical protein